jgi:hypothetical protein
MLFPPGPAAFAVSVSVAPPEPAVTPVVAAVQPLIAAATFVANVAATRLVAKVPVVLPVQVFDPAELPPTALHVKMGLPTGKIERNGPGVFSLTGITLAETVPTVTPTEALPVAQALIALAMLAASVEVFNVGEGIKNVPAVEPVQVWLPLLPGVLLPKVTGPLSVPPKVMVGTLPNRLRKNACALGNAVQCWQSL